MPWQRRGSRITPSLKSSLEMAYLADNSEEQLDLFGEVTALMGALEVWGTPPTSVTPYAESRSR